MTERIAPSRAASCSLAFTPTRFRMAVRSNPYPDRMRPAEARAVPTAQIAARASVPECHLGGHGSLMVGRASRALLPRPLRARVRRPEEMGMGSPRYGQLLIDGEPVSGALEIEAGSLGGRATAEGVDLSPLA